MHEPRVRFTAATTFLLLFMENHEHVFESRRAGTNLAKWFAVLVKAKLLVYIDRSLRLKTGHDTIHNVISFVIRLCSDLCS
jgi:hypothetical protein